MERLTTNALQGAVLVTLLVGAQPSVTQALPRHELSFDMHGRIVGLPVALALDPGEDDQPGSIPNIKC